MKEDREGMRNQQLDGVHRKKLKTKSRNFSLSFELPMQGRSHTRQDLRSPKARVAGGKSGACPAFFQEKSIFFSHESKCLVLPHEGYGPAIHLMLYIKLFEIKEQYLKKKYVSSAQKRQVAIGSQTFKYKLYEAASHSRQNMSLENRNKHGNMRTKRRFAKT